MVVKMYAQSIKISIFFSFHVSTFKSYRVIFLHQVDNFVIVCEHEQIVLNFLDEIDKLLK